jgi:Protein of unknown function (DUF3102)
MAKTIRKTTIQKKTMSKTKTRSQWAADIIASHKQSIEAILKMGSTLNAAKKALDHGEFQKMIESDLPFDASTAQRLMKIARDPRIRKTAHVQLLPIAWGTLYELTQLPDEEFNDAIKSGAINPKMTREQARTVRVKSSDNTVRIVAPYYKMEEPTSSKVVVLASGGVPPIHKMTEEVRPPPVEDDDDEAIQLLRRLSELLVDPDQDWPKVFEEVGDVREIVNGLQRKLDQCACEEA